MHFNFIACNQFNINALDSHRHFVEYYADFQGVVLSSVDELNLLFELWGIRGIVPQDTGYREFPKLWDISGFTLPVLAEPGYDRFIREWCVLTKRETTMNDYGNFLFLQGLTGNWNQLNKRIVVLEA